MLLGRTFVTDWNKKEVETRRKRKRVNKNKNASLPLAIHHQTRGLFSGWQMSSMTKPSVYNALQLRLIKESGNKRINLPTKLIQARRGTCIKSCRTLTRSCMITLLQIFSEQKKTGYRGKEGGSYGKGWSMKTINAKNYREGKRREWTTVSVVWVPLATGLTRGACAVQRWESQLVLVELDITARATKTSQPRETVRMRQ